MLKYARVVNSSGLCEVGLGDDKEFYESLGMTLQDVEQAWNEHWYLADKVPSRPRDVEIRKEIRELQEWLSAHDYIGTKIATGRASIEEYADIISQMKEKAERINVLKEELKTLPETI